MAWFFVGYLVLGLVVSAAATLGNEGRDDWTAADALFAVVAYPVYGVLWVVGLVMAAWDVAAGRWRSWRR